MQCVRYHDEVFLPSFPQPHPTAAFALSMFLCATVRIPVDFRQKLEYSANDDDADT